MEETGDLKLNVEEFKEKCRKLGLPEEDIEELTEQALNAKAIRRKEA